MRDAGVPVAIAVDGSASNDSGHLLAELRLGLLLQRADRGADAMSAREMLEIGTLGGARVLGRDDVGALAAGMAADLIGVPLTDVALAGADDAVAALLLCQVARVGFSVVNGRPVVRDGALLTADLDALVHRQRLAARRLTQHCSG
jgi:cytosine/adenosine deaminase-related metal-dependent hydrolase